SGYHIFRQTKRHSFVFLVLPFYQLVCLGYDEPSPRPYRLAHLLQHFGKPIMGWYQVLSKALPSQGRRPRETYSTTPLQMADNLIVMVEVNMKWPPIYQLESK